jgi:hypothetical protein
MKPDKSSVETQFISSSISLASRFWLKSDHHQSSIQSKQQANRNDLATCSTLGGGGNICNVTIIITISWSRKMLLIINCSNGRFVITSYYNDNCDVWPPQDHTDSTAWWQVITWCLLFALYNGLMMDWFQLETCNQVYEREYELCFDW